MKNLLDLAEGFFQFWQYQNQPLIHKVSCMVMLHVLEKVTHGRKVFLWLQCYYPLKAPDYDDFSLTKLQNVAFEGWKSITLL